MQPGSTIGRFEIQQPLGQGGMATVYQVRHRQLDTVHALKLLKISHPNMARRLLQEGRIQARLRHPNVVAVADIVEHEGAIGLLMEFVEGFSLEDCLRDGQMEIEDALGIFQQVLAGVGAAHAAGVTHRDLKPANILLTTTGDLVLAKVTDFGIAKVLSENEGQYNTRAGVAMGTPGYMAPEQIIDSSGVDHRADIFALGAILYEMLAGLPAFRGADQLVTMNRTTAGTYLPLSECGLDLPRRVCDAVDRALRVDRDDRFIDCAALARALYDDDSFIATSPPDSAEPRPRARPEPMHWSAPTLAPAGLGEGGTFGDMELVDHSEDDPADQPTDDTFIEDPSGPVAPTGRSVIAERWGLKGDSVSEMKREIRREITGSEEDEEEDEDERADLHKPVEVIDARDAANMMGDLFWSMVRATLWGIGKTVQFGGIPIILIAGFAWISGTRTVDELENLASQRTAQAISLNRAMDEGLATVPSLVAAGANDQLLASLQRRYEEASTPAAKVEAARELSSVMTQLLGQLPPPEGEEATAERRTLEMALVKLDREAARYGDIDRKHHSVQDSVGGKLAVALKMVPSPD